MPHLTQSCGSNGPVIRLFVGVSTPRKETIEAIGGQVPHPVLINGLIDTGADATCIDPTCLLPLGLQPRGFVPMITPSTGAQPVDAPQYDVDIFLLSAPGQNSVRLISTVPIVGAGLVNQGIQALVGRDILDQCLFIYDGHARTFTLAI